MLGRLLKGQRHDWVLASKIGNAMGQGPNQAHYSRQWLVRGVEASLARLDTDFLDILYLHRDYHEENLEEAVWALGDLIRAGKLRGFGLSNFRGWRIAEVIRLCAQLACRSRWSASRTTTCSTVAPRSRSCPPAATMAWAWCRTARSRAACSRASTCRARPPGGHARRSWRPPHPGHRVPRGIAADRAAAGRACRRARVQPGPFATAWVLANPLVSSVIAGPRTLAQMQDDYAALDLRITPEDETLVDDWVTPGHASTHGYNDPNYPFHGRPVPAPDSAASDQPCAQRRHQAANSTYRQISQGWPPPLLSRAVAMMGVMPEAKMPEN